MKKFKVTLQLMVNPIQGDHTFAKTYTVDARNEEDAYWVAEPKQENDEPRIAKCAIFSYKAEEIM